MHRARQGFIATITRRAPVTRSMAPPMPGTIFPGIIQFASRRSGADCLLPFDYDLPNGACCRKLTLAAFSANDKSYLGT